MGNICDFVNKNGTKKAGNMLLEGDLEKKSLVTWILPIAPNFWVCKKIERKQLWIISVTLLKKMGSTNWAFDYVKNMALKREGAGLA